MDILISPTQLRKTADNLLDSSRNISRCMHSVDEIIQNIGTARFTGQQADQLRRTYQSTRDQLMSAHKLVSQFSTQLETLARDFENEDKKLASNRLGSILPGLNFRLPDIGGWIAGLIGGIGLTWPPRISLFDGLDLPRAPWNPKPVYAPDIEKVESAVSFPAFASAITDPSAIFQRGLSSTHKGLDISAKLGTPLFASYKGTVAFSSDIDCANLGASASTLDFEEHNPKTNYGFGNEMIIEYKFDEQTVEVQKQWEASYGLKPGQSLYAQYAHLQHGTLTSSGTTINPSEQIAGIGNSGCSTGPHVHLALKVGDSGKVYATDSHNTNGWYRLSNIVDPEKVNVFTPL